MAHTVSRALGLLSAIVTAAGCGLLTNGWPDERSGRLYCRALGDYLEEIRANDPRDSQSDLRVPLAIHIMDTYDNDVVKNDWTKKKIGTYFASGEFSVNYVWAQAGIRFDVISVEHCRYGSLPRTIGVSVLPPDAAEQRKVSPSEQSRRIADYLDTNTLYGVRGAVNLYIWQGVLGRTNGYGESPRRNRREVEDSGRDALSTVWFEGGLESCDKIPTKCRWRLAHELGHSLGLPHTCQACNVDRCCTAMCWDQREYYYDCPTGQGTLCEHHTPVSNGACCCGCEPGDEVRVGFNLCEEQFKCCGADDLEKARLMFTEFEQEYHSSGETLCSGEIHSARSAVREFFLN